eukprot:CAMPEP_0183832752 /NCGR_PEP_ID=MMETSP0807_2-20130328/5639_1 /TAXON_ID=88271 /ORGANISM="Picocystis salinarum, Strain CCMP1897" /LENGTH=654 /DNA_ID=CAMNT_0026078551 /DNA_START=91 /DNA_END=2052 /DNA_ORIENTATION=+
MITVLFCLIFSSIVGYSLAAFYFRNVKRTIDSKIVHKISTVFSDDSVLSDGELEECYETLMLHRDNIVRFLPLWCKLPYFQRLAWANTMITSMWSQIKSYAEKTAVSTIMGDKDNVGYLEYYLPGMKDKLKLECIDCGKNPLRVLSVNVFNTPDEELMIALQVSWASRMKLVMVYPLKVLGYSTSFKLVFSELQFSTTLRVWGSPLVDQMPCIGKASLSLGDVPDLDFSLRFALNEHLSGDLMAVPGLHWLFKYFITRVLQQSIVWPSQYVMELMESGGRSPPPAGVLTVNLIKASRVKDKDWTGLDLDDLYAVMNIRNNEKVTSTVKKNNTDPYWNEKFTLLLTDTEKDCLTIQLYDFDKLLTDTQLCYATLPLNLLSEEVLQDFELQLYKHDVRGQELKKEAAAHLQEEESLRDIQKRSSADLDENKIESDEAALPSKGLEDNRITEAIIDTNSEDEPTRTFYQNREGVYCEHGDNLYPLKGATVKVSVLFSRIHSSNLHSSSKMESSFLQTKRNMKVRKSKDARGLLRVVLLRADELEGFKKLPENIMRPYARLQMEEDTRNSAVKKYTDSPNWNETFDFNNVSPDSKLVVEIFHKWKRKLFNKLFKRKDISLGHVEIPLDDVMRNESLTNVFKLRSTRSGAVQLQLIWHW